MMYSLNYIISEGLLTGPHPSSARDIQTLNSTYVCCFVTVYLIVYTIPGWNTLVVDKVHEKGGSWIAIILMYIMLALSSYAHTITFFNLMGSVGSISTGILQSLRAVSVFIISHLLFCDTHANQCYNAAKGLSTVVVVLGILYFSKITAELTANPNPKKDEFEDV